MADIAEHDGALVDVDDDHDRPVENRPPRWPAAVAMAVALATRLPGIGHPRFMVFDEVFYATDALDTLQWGAEHGRAVHPPLGKILIASGIRMFGFTPFGYRFASLVAGVLVVGLSAAVVARLTRRGDLALAAGLLVALDGVMFTSGRLAMLDVFVALFVMATAWFLAVAWTLPPEHSRRVRRAVVGAITAAALGGGVKWSSLWLLPVVVVVAWVLDRRRRPAGRRLRAAGLTLVLAAAIPLAVYALVWAPREVGPARLSPSEFVEEQQAVARFHLRLRPTNSNASPATTWLWLDDPSGLFRETCVKGMAHEPTRTCPADLSADREVRILSLPSPVVWVVGLAGLIGSAVVVAVRRDGATAWVLAAAATQWLPWMANPRAAYSFYMASLIPLMVVAAALVAARGSRRAWTVGTWASVVLAVAAFAFFYPVWAAVPLSVHAYDLRMWLRGWT